MPPNLSFERLALVLALTGCSKATPAADAVRSDPGAASQTTVQAAPPPPLEQQAATATASAAPARDPGAASATELKKRKMGGGSTGQASCGAGSCTSDIKKK